LSDSSGYREIALSSVFGKVLDLIILNRYADFLINSELQFGFKAKRSTSMCTMVQKEAINYYTSKGSSVFCTCLLGVSLTLLPILGVKSPENLNFF